MKMRRKRTILSLSLFASLNLLYLLGVGGEVIQEFEISEGSPVGTSIGFIGRISSSSSHSPPPPPYLIVPSPGSTAVDSDLTIDQSNGEILTRVPLDRETRDSYSLVAIPMSAGENIRVIIKVKDENDHAPEFPSPFMQVEFPENTPRDVKRTLQPAKDKDLGIYNTQRYTISRGNVNNAFRLSSHRERDGVLYLDIQVNGFLDRETIPSYSLVIEAFDGGVPPLKGSMTINITITDQNDNAPMWQFPRLSNPEFGDPSSSSSSSSTDLSLQTRYFATIPENATVGTSVLQVHATDIDEGANGEVSYSINHRRQTDKDKEAVFRIDRNSGVIFVNGPLDYETKEVYELVVVARDSGIHPLETTVFVTIRVLDLNDNQMEINISFFSDDSDHSPPRVSEKALPGEFVARIGVIDPETKQEYNASGVSISLKDGNGYFLLESVNSAVYLVVGTKRLDREVKSSFTLGVVANDKGNPGLNASTTFILQIEDDNDSPPVFEVEEYHASVMEMAEVGSVVIQVKARDDDVGENARISYELLNTPETQSNWFEINKESGVITTRSQVDCEANPNPVLTVVAKDNGRPQQLTGSATVVVHLIDTNDTPIFNQGFYNASVQETAPYGTCLLKVSATDPDCGVNAELSYNLLDAAILDLPFSMNSKSGEICVSGPLDYEKKDVYQILVSASDTGGLSSTAVVNIHIVDENDNVPTFYPRSYSVSVEEGVVPQGPIVVVAAKDPDSSQFGEITYSFLEGNEDGVFSINKNTGEISLTRGPTRGGGGGGNTRRNNNHVYRLRVTARDGDNQIADQHADISVHVFTKQGGGAPMFQKPRYLFQVPEDFNTHSSIGSVAASGNGRVRYSIVSGDPKSFFTIDSNTGSIKLSKRLDREEYARFLLNVQAKSDQHEVISYSQVEVRVTDTNDNAPRFEAKDVKIWIPETLEVGAIVYVAKAVDKDEGAKGEVSYILVQNPLGMFKLDRATGVVTLQRPLDYETVREFGIVVKARDNGSPPKSSEVLTLYVEVQDANDNAPVWFKKNYEFLVREKSPAGTFIGRLTKQDKNQNGSIKFQMDPQTGGFQVDADSGIISTTAPLERRAGEDNIHQLKITAYNQLPSIVKAEFTVIVHVVEANSRMLISTLEEGGITQYHVNVTESTKVNSEITQVVALDEDFGNNARVTYTIEESPLQNVVGIYPSTGIVFLKEPLDREIQDEFVVKVIATDHGIPTLSSTATIYLKVLDENDNAPKFERDLFKFHLKENNERGSVIGHVAAHDKDQGENGAVSYFIQPPHPDFSIDEKTGTITATSSLDREKQSMYELQAVAVDHGYPRQQAEVIVQVFIKDENDNDPQIIEPDQDSLTIRERLPIGTEVARVMAFDADEGSNARITYQLRNDDFEIDKETGALRTKRVLTRSSKPLYDLQVRARDHGSPSRESIRSYRVEIADATDKWSESLFVPPKLRFKVRENVTIGHTVGKILAQPTSSLSKPQIFYQLLDSPNDDGTFEIHGTTGSLIVAKKLDYESIPRYTLQVLTTMQTPFSFSEAKVKVEIDVVDVNDERPKFQEDPISFVVSEGTPIGSPVWNFSAVDTDSGLNGLIHYSIAEQQPHQKFRINILSGVLYLQSPLDYEQCNSFVLVVTATDQPRNGEDRLNSSVTVSIRVEDENDNAPVFTSSSSVEIYEMEPLKTEFHTVIAKDADSSKFGEVEYKIVSGNDEGLFLLQRANGRLSLARQLKKDVKRYTLNISAFDLGVPSKVAYQTLSISVKSDKSYAPRFTSAKYEAKVVENCAIGTQVVQVAASVSDYERNNTIFLIPGEGGFTINPRSGFITVSSPIDREVKSEYKVDVYLQHVKQGYIFDTAEVLIHVVDENDNAPNFHDSCTDLNVPENNELGVIHVFTAEDKDVGKNGEVTFMIGGGNQDNLFSVDLHTGKFSGRPLDRERRSQYNILVVAQDQGTSSKKATCNMTIYVDDENDSPIVFEVPSPQELQKLRKSVSHPSFKMLPSGQGSYSASIPENVGVGTRVLKVQANDADVGVNSLIKYSLNNESHWHFAIDNSTGEIFTAGALDREKIGTYVFEVAATDGGLYDSRISTALVTLTITDYNDNRPQFKENPVFVKVPATTSSGQNIAQVSATDKDEGLNADVAYTLESHDDLFTINRLNGQISALKSLSSERGKVFHLQVTGKDQGSPSQTSTALVVIQVGEIDPQQTLKFRESSYQVKLLENPKQGEEVVKVQAQPARGDGRRSRVVYSIAGGNEDGVFQIDPSSGTITVKDGGKVDRENQDSFKLVVTGKTEDSRPLLAHVAVNIKVVDVNDNYPRFTQNGYISSVWEGNTKGTFVTQVTATDPDEGANANVVYHIIDGNQDNAFVIDPPFSGIVKTNIVLDREILDEYRLTIIATDEGTPQMTGTAYLHVKVIDIQDQSPVFPPHSVITVKEDAPIGSLITVVAANDVDTNPALVYSFTDNGNPEGLFTIGKYTGRITLAKPLDFEKTKLHKASIQVSDSVHTAQTELTVNVADQNDCPPQFLKSVYRIIVSEGAKVGTKVGSVNATDNDSGDNGRVKYSLRSLKMGPRFLRIDETTGVIYLNSSINYNREEPFTQLIVVATDYGKPQPLSSEASLWIEIRPAHSQILKFSQAKYRSMVYQNAKPGTLISKLSVETTDQVVKGLHYHFTIVSGNEGDYFSINSHTGRVVLAKPLTHNAPSSFALVVSADCVNMEQRSSVTELSIEVSSQNENELLFDKPNYKVTVSENKPVGSTLVKLHATESKSNGSLVYEITSGNEDSIVELNKKSGVLLLKRSLDYDNFQNNYRIVVKAVSSSEEAWNFTTVDITVDDENDNEPKFLFPTYVAFLGENEPIGTTVCTIKATDFDKGIYGKLQYSILDGDGKDKFSIASSTGVITTNAIFDYESKSRYYLTLRANDIGGKSSTTKLQIEIESKDEFTPQFIQTSYRFEVPLNAGPSYIFGQVEAVDQDRGPDGLVAYTLAEPNPYFAVNFSTGYLILKTIPNEHINSTFPIMASSGRNGSKYAVTSVEAVLGFPLKELELAASSSTTDWVLGILVTTFLLLFIICGIVLLLHMRNRRDSTKGGKVDAFNSSNFDTLDYAAPTMRIGGGSKQDSVYGSHYGNIVDMGRNRRMNNNAISEISEQSNSASSGRGSAEDGEEDEEVCMINEGSLAQQRLRVLEDEEEEEDNLSQTSAKNTQEYLARLGIRENLNISNDGSSHHIYDNGSTRSNTNKDADMSALIYSQISDDLSLNSASNSNKPTYKNVPQPSVTGSLSSVVHNDEELASNYNWDYLLDWGPQYQPLAHVFSEIAHLKEGGGGGRNSSKEEHTYCGILPSNSSSTGDKPPIPIVRTGPLPPVPILPRSPINELNFHSAGPISPSFAPALSPLANRSPPLSPLGNMSTNSIRTSQIHDPDYRSDSEIRM